MPGRKKGSRISILRSAIASTSHLKSRKLIGSFRILAVCFWVQDLTSFEIFEDKSAISE